MDDFSPPKLLLESKYTNLSSECREGREVCSTGTGRTQPKRGVMMDWFVPVNEDLSLGHSDGWKFSPDVQ